jgi:hypothetical protein
VLQAKKQITDLSAELQQLRPLKRAAKLDEAFLPHATDVAFL